MLRLAVASVGAEDADVANAVEEDDAEARAASIAANLRARRVIAPPRMPFSGSQPAGTIEVMSPAILLAAFEPFGAIAAGVTA